MSKLVKLLLASGAWLSTATAARAQDITYDALTHYTNCTNEAVRQNDVRTLDRYVMYRCQGLVATSYFNYLGRKRAKERRVLDPTEVIVYRYIKRVGLCWHRISYTTEGVISTYTCDIYYEI